MHPTEQSTFDLVRGWIEIAYFLAGVSLPVIGLFALRQVRLAKEQLDATIKVARTAARRDSFLLAVEQCSSFAKTVTPLEYTIDKYLGDREITYFDRAKVSISDKGILVSSNGVNQDNLPKLAELTPTLSDLINAVEAFACYVLAGIANEEIAFRSQGRFFVDKAETVAKIVAVSKSTGDGCQHIWPLYRKWHGKLEHEKLIIERQRIDEQLKTTIVEASVKNVSV